MLPVNVYPREQLEVMRDKALALSIKLKLEPVEEAQLFKGYSTYLDIKNGKKTIGKIVKFDDGKYGFFTLLETRGRTHHSFTLGSYVSTNYDIVCEVAKRLAAFKHVECHQFLTSSYDLMKQRAASDFSEKLDDVILSEAITEFTEQAA
jgi:hypothetical protein